MIEPGRAMRRRRAALSLPGVQGEVVVVAAGCEKCRLAAIALLQLEAENAGVESERPVEVGDLEVDMPDTGARMDRPRRELRLDEGKGAVEWHDGVPLLDLLLPQRAPATRAVPVKGRNEGRHA